MLTGTEIAGKPRRFPANTNRIRFPGREFENKNQYKIVNSKVLPIQNKKEVHLKKGRIMHKNFAAMV